MRTLCLILLQAAAVPMVCAQAPRMNEAAAKEAVYRVVRHSGLRANFIVREDPQVRTANAYIKGRERVIAYNPDFLSRLLDSTRTDWAAVSVLAHEIAHHLLGHTLDPEAVHPGDELACDHYSGFIVQRMGATLEEARAAMQAGGQVHGTRTHPPRHARLEAITQGWQEADRLAHGDDQCTFTVERPFLFVVRFVGDANTYYVDQENALVWFNTHAQPISFGTCTPTTQGSYRQVLTWGALTFHADAKGTLWSAGPNGLDRAVGTIKPFASAER